MDESVAAKELLQAVRKAVKATEKLMRSEDEDVQVFAVDATVKLTEVAVALLTALKSKEVREERNPLARRARVER